MYYIILLEQGYIGIVKPKILTHLLEKFVIWSD